MNGFDQDFMQDWLPEIYRDTSVSGLLKIIGVLFEGIHARIDELPETIAPRSPFFDGATPEQRQYLKWFSGWVNLVLSEDWDYAQQREILAKILPLYKKRGTREGLREYLKIYAGGGISILDDLPSIQLANKASSQVGVNMIIGGFPPETPALQLGNVSRIGKDTIIGGFPPYFFIVRAAVSEGGPVALRKKRKAIIDILEMEKPAHTWYRLSVRGPAFQIGDKNTASLGINTII